MFEREQCFPERCARGLYRHAPSTFLGAAPGIWGTRTASTKPNFRADRFRLIIWFGNHVSASVTVDTNRTAAVKGKSLVRIFDSRSEPTIVDSLSFHRPFEKKIPSRSARRCWKTAAARRKPFRPLCDRHHARPADAAAVHNGVYPDAKCSSTRHAARGRCARAWRSRPTRTAHATSAGVTVHWIRAKTPRACSPIAR